MRGHAIGRILKRTALVTATLLTTAAAIGFVLQQRRDARITAEHPPPGQFVDVGGHRLHYRLRGSGPVTFVLEAGAAEYSGSWGEFEDGLAELGRVLAYDRAGLGWSEPGPRPRTSARVAAELNRVLEALAVPPPRILVGHSLGGAFATRYAMDHPDRVAGLLLIDPSHRDQFDRLSSPPAWQRWLVFQLPRLASLRLPFLIFGPSDPMKNRSTHMKTYGAELRAFMGFEGDRKTDPLRAGARDIDLGGIPTIVLTAGESAPWRALHAELAEASSSELSRQTIVEDSDHYIHRARPAVVLDAAAELRDAALEDIEVLEPASSTDEPDGREP